MLGEAVGLLEVLLDRCDAQVMQPPKSLVPSSITSPSPHPITSQITCHHLGITLQNHLASPCITWASPGHHRTNHLPSPAITCHHLTITWASFTYQ